MKKKSKNIQRTQTPPALVTVRWYKIKTNVILENQIQKN